MNRRRERAWGLVYALCCGGLYSLPLFVAIHYDADFTYFANEALAYRYFLSERLSSGEYAWVWQGHLTTSIQNLIYLVVDRWLAPSASDLHLRLQLFSLLTLGSYAVLMTGLFLIAGQIQSLHWLDRFSIAMVALTPLYATLSGSYYHLAPDYNAMNTILAAGAVLVFQYEWRSKSTDRSLGRIALLGAYCGLLAASKIYMAILGAFVVVPFLFGPHPKASTLAFRTAVALAGALSALCMVLLIFYFFDVGALRRMLRVWFGAMAGIGAKANLMTSGFLGVWDAYRSLAVLWLVATVIVVIDFLKSRTTQNGVLIACNVLGALAALLVLLRYPAGTTAFDVAVLFLAFTAMLVTSFPRSTPYTIASIVAGIGFVLLQGHALNVFNAIHWITGSYNQGKVRWQLHDEIMRMADGRRIITVIPANDYAFGGVPELLLKGASDFPTWNVSASGQRLIDRYAPHMTFRYADGPEPEKPDAPYPRDVLVMWWDKPNEPTLTEKYPALKEAVSRQHVVCRQWKQPEAGLDVKACLVP